MFKFFETYKKCKELEGIIARIDSNVANNYKDAAQEALRDFEKKLNELDLPEDKKASYSSRLDSYKIKMKEFTHKDQKPYWTRN